MTKKDKLIVAKLLEMASEEFSNHTCNDLPKNFLRGWTKEEKISLLQNAVELNVIEKEDFEEAMEENDIDWLLNDYGLMDIYSKLLKEEAKL